MPKRTNEFQKLVLLVKAHKAAGANVTESKFLRDRYTKTDREIDICIETVVAGHPKTLSIECTAKAGRADVGWVEQMMLKHQHLPTNRLVLASKSGFTAEAKAKAEAHGVELISLDELDDDEAKRLFGGSSSLWFKSFHLRPTKVVLHVPASNESQWKTSWWVPFTTSIIMTAVSQAMSIT